MKAKIMMALWLVALCSVCLGGITITPLEPFGTGDQPHWKVDVDQDKANYIPDSMSLETPTIYLNPSAIVSTITVSIASDAVKFRLNGPDALEFDTSSAKEHTLFLSFREGATTLYFDGQQSAKVDNLWLATVARHPQQIPLAFVGANYVALHFQLGTKPPPRVADTAPAIAPTAAKQAETRPAVTAVQPAANVPTPPPAPIARAADPIRPIQDTVARNPQQPVILQTMQQTSTSSVQQDAFQKPQAVFQRQMNLMEQQANALNSSPAGLAPTLSFDQQVVERIRASLQQQMATLQARLRTATTADQKSALQTIMAALQRQMNTLDQQANTIKTQAAGHAAILAAPIPVPLKPVSQN